MKETYGLQCFEIDLDRAWFLLNETEYDATSDSFAFYNEELDVRLYIYGERKTPPVATWMGLRRD